MSYKTSPNNSHSQGDGYQPGGELDEAVTMGDLGTSFWDLGQYKRTVKRIEDGYRLSTEYSSMLQERGAIEEGYAKALRAWSKKWDEKMDKGPEYGTMHSAWKCSLNESERLARIHISIRDGLSAHVLRAIKDWQKENFHRSVVPLNQIKEAKEMEETFRKTQKPWAKLYKKVLETKKFYHLMCKYEKTAVIQESNSRSDTSKSPEEQKRLREKVERCKEDVYKSRERYQSSLKELNNCNAKYMEDMKEVFEKCQKMEENRMSFFKQILYTLQKSLDPTQYDDLSKIYEDLRNGIDFVDIPKDLSLFSNTNGIGTFMNWPVFEEYSPEIHSISKRVGKAVGGTDLDSGVTLKSIVLKEGVHLKDDYSKYNNDSPTFNNGYDNLKNESRIIAHQINDEVNNSIDHDLPEDFNCRLTLPPRASLESRPSSTPSELKDSADRSPGMDGRPHVIVRALYDYSAQEDDELSFTRGDILQQLAEKDEQGWCQGRDSHNKVGLYPAEYVKAI
ncbi:protein kinase C and casein kinase II substrate protein 3-like isoform X2 [Gordionus sp. m RMFG-2023]|uniref:protein kinase C and casein kinase II substrate protein 3-like isoform X2 n=1 Tax=Gordionus sp. m RMFG-2023 TaxID=3053472 RepID=UPI0031FD7D7C